MQYVVLFRLRAEKELRKLPRRDGTRIVRALALLAMSPFAGKKLHGDYQDFYSLRVWPYRVIYYIKKEKRVVIIVRVGHRQGMY